MDKIEKIRQEIERLYGEYKDKFKQHGDQYHLGLIDGLDMAERVLDAISEEPICLDDGGAPSKQKCGDCTIACDAKVEEDRDVVFWKGMQYAIAGMKKDAVEGVIIDSGFDDGTAFVTMNIPDRRYDRGDKVKLIIIKDDGKSD